MQADRAGTFDVEWNGQHFTFDAPAESDDHLQIARGHCPRPDRHPRSGHDRHPPPDPGYPRRPRPTARCPITCSISRPRTRIFTTFNADAVQGTVAYSGVASLECQCFRRVAHRRGGFFSGSTRFDRVPETLLLGLRHHRWWRRHRGEHHRHHPD